MVVEVASVGVRRAELLQIPPGSRHGTRHSGLAGLWRTREVDRVSAGSGWSGMDPKEGDWGGGSGEENDRDRGGLWLAVGEISMGIWEISAVAAAGTSA